MKRVIFIVLIIAALPAFAHHSIDGYQNKDLQHSSELIGVNRSGLHDTAAPRRHAVLWFTPNRHSTKIAGLALGFWAAPEKHSLVIDGVNVELNPAAVVLVFYELFGMVSGPFIKDTATEIPLLTGARFPWSDTSVRAKISGLSISTAQLGTSMKGVGINVVSSWANEMDGLEVSGLMNLHYRFRGLALAMRNKVTYCTGVQIGLFNECREGTLLQIGILNRIGNRRVPFINFSRKGKK